MSLQSRLATLISAIGADIKELKDRVGELEVPTPIDAGGPSTDPTSTIDAGTLL